MRVALVAQPYDSVLPPRQNSIGLVLYHTAIELSRQADVTLYAKHGPGPDGRNDLPFLPVFVPGRGDDILQRLATRYARWTGGSRVSALANAHTIYARSVAKEIDRAEPDVVHVMNYWPWCRKFVGRGHRRRPVVLEMHCEWLSQMDKNQVQNQLAAVDAVVGVSDHIARLFRASFPAYSGQVVTAHDGVDPDVFRPGAGRLVHRGGDLTILFVGRVSPEKGIHTLIEAFGRIASRCPQARLVIAGGRGTLREDFIVDISSDPLVRALSRFYNGSLCSNYQLYLDELVMRFGLDGKVQFLGSIPHKALVDWYQAATVVVNPSLSESFGLSVVEGMACGVPVVGTKVGGMLETVLHGETGLLVDAERSDLLAEALLWVLHDPDAAAKMGATGRVRALEHFSWRARAERLLSTYRTIVNHNRP